MEDSPELPFYLDDMTRICELAVVDLAFAKLAKKRASSPPPLPEPRWTAPRRPRPRPIPRRDAPMNFQRRVTRRGFHGHVL